MIVRRVEKPIRRSRVRQKAGMLYYTALRRLLWIRMRSVFASERSEANLPCICFSHRTILMRKLKDVDMWMQRNKIINLKIAAEKLDGVIIRPGEVFSYWKLIGKTTKRKGYVDGMVLHNGGFSAGTGGGLCQMSNLIFWMAVHTPLTIVERHRHGYDVFPDSNRTQPFGSGATCFYPHGDLMIQNNTEDSWQLRIHVGEEYLEGELRASAPMQYRYEIAERNHEIRSEYWGGYTRHNELYQQIYDPEGNLLNERLLIENSAIMMYSPLLGENQDLSNADKTEL